MCILTSERSIFAYHKQSQLPLLKHKPLSENVFTTFGVWIAYVWKVQISILPSTLKIVLPFSKNIA